MKYQKFIITVSQGCQNHINKLEKTGNFKNRLLSRLEELTDVLKLAEVKKFGFFIDREATIKRVEQAITAYRSHNKYPFSDKKSGVDRKIDEQMDAYMERFLIGVGSLLSGDKHRMAKAIYVEKLKAGAM